jgi:hypothetical protein
MDRDAGLGTFTLCQVKSSNPLCLLNCEHHYIVAAVKTLVEIVTSVRYSAKVHSLQLRRLLSLMHSTLALPDSALQLLARFSHASGVQVRSSG